MPKRDYILCGIAGWVGQDSLNQGIFDRKLQAVKRMIQLQNHRGPDANGVFEDRKCNVIFGHNRLSILELSDAVLNRCSISLKIGISYNGELYNYQKIKQELIERFSVKFKGNSDTEVVLYGVIHFGIDEFLRKADGMFAFAIFNRSRREVFLARDRVGEKPLYFFKSKEGLSFASELKVLGEIFDGNLGIDTTGLQLYLILRYVPPPHTILSGISKLAPGHYLRFSDKNQEIEQIPYFSWDPHASEIPANQENYQVVVKTTANMLIKSLESRLMSDVPLGFFLSGVLILRFAQH